MKYLSILTLFLFCYETKGQPVEQIAVTKGMSIDSLRREIERDLFDNEPIPEPVAELTTFQATEVSEYYASSPNLASVNKSVVELKHGFKSVIYHFVPAISNGINVPVIYHSGHGYGVFLEDDFVNYNYGSDYSGRVIDFFLSKGFNVIGIDMPFFGQNESPSVVEEDGTTYSILSHDDIFLLKNPFYYFLAPIKAAINYYQDQYGCNRFIMFGLSGGGWATTVYSAIDTRICLSFPVAGSIPIPLRTHPRDYGDLEQYYPPFYDKYNYSTLYLLGAAGEGRMQYQILNENDDCCFAFDGNKHWASQIKSVLQTSELPGKFEFFYDTVATNHRISSVATDSIHSSILNNLINDFLKTNNMVKSSSPGNLICDNDTLTLSIPGFGNNTVQWLRGGDETDSVYSYQNQLIVSEEGTYYARINNFSQAVVNTDSLTVKENSIFVEPVVSERNGILCSSYSFGKYQWYYNDRLLAGKTTQCISAEKAGRYSVVVSSGECVSDPSDPFDFGIRLFPNPVSDQMTIRVSKDLSFVYYTINRNDGVGVRKGRFIGETTINVHQLPSGLYFLQLTNLNGFRSTQKFIVK